MLTILMVASMGCANVLYCMGIAPYYQAMYCVAAHYTIRVARKAIQIDKQVAKNRHNDSYIKK